ncbi:hypothetical protein [Amycolatopsis sp. WAC 04169]|uniref:hypothetical protein n=1 Tax=Amycolatopsis sp. WAC 04169 TaxID=2203197 RepID=UPI000F78ACD4|nr:hypothetical protein [Amycolatopsis sp. WAC 04169]
MGLVAGVESYIRSILLGITITCPLSRELVADQMIAVGSIDYYGVKHVNLALFEGASFAGDTEIIKKTKQLTGVTWAPLSSVDVALKAFDRICHMRHAAIHAQGALNRGNARALGVSASNGQKLNIVIELAELHHVARVCIDFVRAYNLEIYRGIVQKWLSAKVLSGVWKNDKAFYKSLFDLFYSKHDGTGPDTAYRSYRLLLPSLAARLAHN